MMSPISTPNLTEQVEIYENERSWIGGGFSKKGLLPTDRRPYSTNDGSLSWKTLDEAASALLGKGWIYEETEFTRNPQQEEIDGTDEHGWRYATDFSAGALQKACDKKGLQHFVRRRKLYRRKRFHHDALLPRDVYVKCDYCDSESVEALSSKILEALAVATLVQPTNKNSVLTDALVLPLKEKLVDSLMLGKPVQNRPGKDPQSRLQMLMKELDYFGEKQTTVVSRACNNLRNFSPTEISDRIALISSTYFGKEERETMASLVIRDLDPEFHFHCHRELCGEECPFRIIPCPNEGCGKNLSKNHLPTHDETCGYAKISCPLGCGDAFPRNRREVHLVDACSLRQVDCSFKKVGCTAVMSAKDAPQHLMESAHSHLLLATNRMMEYETLFRDLLARVKHLETQNAQFKQQAESQASELAVAQAKIQAMQKQHVAMGKDLSSANSQISSVTKKVSSLDSSCRAEFKKIGKQQQR